MPPVVLASGSPRRAELLGQIGIPFEVVVAGIDERQLPDEAPDVYVMRLAEAKALAVEVGERVRIGADTAVVVDGNILGKPVDRWDAERMLKLLQNRVHQVVTGVCVAVPGRCRTVSVSADVCFRKVSDAEIEAYVATGEGADKAGGYGIQGIGGIFAERIDGSYSAVVGLPLCEVEELLREFGVDTWRGRRHV